LAPFTVYFKKEKIFALTKITFPHNFVGKSHLLTKCRENINDSFCKLLKDFGQSSDMKTKTSFFLDWLSEIKEDRLPLHTIQLKIGLCSIERSRERVRRARSQGPVVYTGRSSEF
jgi:hypothetical protein